MYNYGYGCKEGIQGGRNLTAFSRGILESKAIEILSKQAKAEQVKAGSNNLKQYNAKRSGETSSLCNIAQTSKLKETPKIDVKKELAKRIGTGEQTASRILPNVLITAVFTNCKRYYIQRGQLLYLHSFANYYNYTAKANYIYKIFKFLFFQRGKITVYRYSKVRCRKDV